MPEINEEGQEMLLKAKVIIIGAGGLGCPLGLYLAGAGIGEITLVDNDIIEISNLNRQIAFTNDDLGKSKSDALKVSMTNLNPTVKVISIKDRLSNENISDLFYKKNLVVDCTDNFETRHLIAKECLAQKIPMSFGSAVRQEGQTAFFLAGCNESKEDFDKQKKPCYACIFPIKPKENNNSRCSEAGILGPITGLISSIQALNVIRYLTNQKISETLILWDGLSFLEIKITNSHSCPICS